MSSNRSVAAEQDDRLSKAAVVILRLKEKIALLEDDEKKRSEPIAVVGIGCRFPGGADGPDAFWSLLDEGRDAVQRLDARWSLVGSRPSEEAPSWAGLLTGAVDTFDAAGPRWCNWSGHNPLWTLRSNPVGIRSGRRPSRSAPVATPSRAADVNANVTILEDRG